MELFRQKDYDGMCKIVPNCMKKWGLEVKRDLIVGEILFFKGNTEPFNDAVVEHMFVEYFFNVFFATRLVPYIVGVDDNSGAVVAGIETACLVDADFAFEAHFV